MKILDYEFDQFNVGKKELLSSIDIISEVVSGIVWDDLAPRIVLHYTDHGIKHSLSILKILNSLLTNSIKVRLSDDEQYLLIICAFLHDIGLQCDPRLEEHKDIYRLVIDYDPSFKFHYNLTELGAIPEEDQQLIRSSHHNLSAAWIQLAFENKKDSIHYPIKSITEKFLSDTINICRYHSKMKMDISLPQSENNQVRLEFLILLLRIADELDIGKHRINQKVLLTYYIPNKNSMHWYLNAMTTCSIDDLNDISLEIHLHSQDNENHADIMKKVISDFEEKNRIIFEKLRTYGLYISFSSYKSKVVSKQGVSKLPQEIINAMYYDILKAPYTTGEIKYSDPKTRVTCYISYYSSDVTDINISEIINMIIKLSNKTFDVIYFNKLKDKSTESLNNAINSSDCIIVLLTRGYLNAINKFNTEKTIYQEYKAIINKLGNHTDETLFLVKYDPNISDSEFEQINLKIRIKKLDLAMFRPIKLNNGMKKPTNYFPNNIQKKHYGVFEKIISETRPIVTMKSEQYIDMFEQMYFNFFLVTKSEEFELPSEVFVNTNSYNKLSKGNANIVIGRKGTGKSTVINGISRNIDLSQYKGILKVNVERISLNSTYNDWYIRYDPLETDLKEVLGPNKIITLIWEVYLYVYSLHIVYDEYINNALRRDQESAMKRMLKAITTEFRWFNDTMSEDELSPIIYDYSVSAVFDYIDNIAKNYKEDSDIKKAKKRADLLAQMEIGKFLECHFENVIVSNYKNVLVKCCRRILVTMDRFDTHFEEQRRNDLDQSNFEKIWLQSFIDLMYRIKQGNYIRPNSLYDIIDFTICIPYHRWIEITKDDIDKYRLHSRIVDLRWSGIELATMLRNRIEYLYPKIKVERQKMSEKLSPEDLLNWCFKQQFPNLPESVVANGKKGEPIPLFLYVLRRTFWRPRDILTHYAAIIALLTSYKNYSLTPSQMQDEIKTTIKKTTTRIIKDEFVDEFRAVLINLEEIINTFANSKQVLTYDELVNIFGGLTFRMVYGHTLGSFEDKFSILYEIGFIGIEATAKFKKNAGFSHNNAFTFNEKDTVLDKIKNDEEFKKCRFIIHPIFVEYLNLDNNSNKYLCDYSWEYLHRLEKLPL